MAEAENTTQEKRKQPVKRLIVHAYRGIPEVHSWSYYKKLDRHWTVCGYERRGIGGIAEIGTPPPVGHHGTVEAAKVNCPFCLDLIENTQKRQAQMPPDPGKLGRAARRGAVSGSRVEQNSPVSK